MANRIQHFGNPGTTPAVIASILVPEVIKYFMGVGDLLADRLLIYDGMSIGFRDFKVKK